MQSKVFLWPACIPGARTSRSCLRDLGAGPVGPENGRRQDPCRTANDRPGAEGILSNAAFGKPPGLAVVFSIRGGTAAINPALATRLVHGAI